MLFGKKEERGEQTEKGGAIALPESDLACERRRADLSLPGVERRTERKRGMSWERIRITSEEGAASIGRPCGRYDTLTLDRMDKLDEEDRDDAAAEIAAELCRLAEANGIAPQRLLVVGLGNGHLTPDAVGPRAAAEVHATLHIKDFSPSVFEGMECAEIAVCLPGVMAESGMEACETVIGLCDRITPDAVIAIDALAARSSERLGRTVQISDTGIFPGSGIGNSRAPLNEETLGIPVIAIGVPTVIDARVFLCEEARALGIDLQEKAKKRNGEGDEAPAPTDAESARLLTRPTESAMYVSPREIDGITFAAAQIIARGINQAFGIL